MIVEEERGPFVMLGCETKLFSITTYGGSELFSFNVCDYFICIVTYSQNIFSSRVSVKPECFTFRIIRSAACCNELFREAVHAYLNVTLDVILR